MAGMSVRGEADAFGEDLVDFGALPDEINALLQQGVAAYRTDPGYAEALFGAALAAAPGQLPIYFCLYKIHTYQGRLDAALSAANDGLAEAARQAGWPADWTKWRIEATPCDGAGRFALYTLKALAFIRLKRDERDECARILRSLRALDPGGGTGWPVVAALLEAA